MNFDHHVVEPILLLLFFALPFLEEGEGCCILRVIASAALFPAALLLWRGSTLFWGLAFASVLVRVIVLEKRFLAAHYAKVFLAASMLLTPVCLLTLSGTGAGASLVVISWIHPLILACFAAVLACCVVAPRKLRLWKMALALVPVLLVGTIFVPKPFFIKAIEASYFMFGIGDTWLRSINELEGTFTTYGFLDGVQYVTLGFFIAPLAIVVAFLQWRRTGNDRLLHFVCWYSISALALVYRYALYSSVIVALAIGYLVSIGWRRLPAIRRTALAVLLPVAVIAPSMNISIDAANQTLDDVRRNALFGRSGVIEWIRNNTPTTSNYLTPSQPPEYGILADWELGSFLYACAERPALATPFGWETHGFYEHAAFFAAESPSNAMAILSTNHIRYVLVAWGHSQEFYYQVARSGERKHKLPPGTVGKTLSSLDTMYYRLLYQEGSGYAFPDGYRKALGNMRLVYETDLVGGLVPSSGVYQSFYKLYEVVTGATIEGAAKPGSEVLLSLSLLSSRGRPYKYEDITKADETGKFSFVVPYATGAIDGSTHAGEKYVVSTSAGKRQVSVTEEQIMHGATIRLGIES
jgi:dolichyl-diphosphooligosaccharide--protein glycosyltransferase